MTQSKTYYGLVNDSMWGYPEFIDQDLAAVQREKLKNVPYGLSESYRHMCRFQRYCMYFFFSILQETDLIYIRIVASFGDIHSCKVLV
jgi:hypothetical protein